MVEFGQKIARSFILPRAASFPVCEDQGRNLGEGCQRPDEVVLVGGRVCCKALVKGLVSKGVLELGETHDGRVGEV